MDTVSQLQSMGLTLPTPAYLAGMFLFSLIGMAAWMAGKRMQKATTKWLGVAHTRLRSTSTAAIRLARPAGRA